MAPSLKLTYFAGPGKAEALRLLCALGGLTLNDNRLDYAAWGQLKPTIAPRQLPVFEVDGEEFGQSLAQQRYVAKVAGLYPSDPLAALRVDEFVDYVSEVFGPLGKSFGIEDQAEKEAFRAAMVAEGGDVHKWVQFLDARLEGKAYAVGDALSFADVALFAVLPFLRSGALDGIPTDCFDGFKNVRAHFARVAALPKVEAYYATAEGTRAVFARKW